MNILFVCTGNTCRSPMAAAIMDKIANEEALDVSIESAGVLATENSPATPEAVEALKKYNIDLSEHKSKPISQELIDKSDLIITMTEAHKLLLQGLAKDKTCTLCELADMEGEISDPFGGDLDEYESTADMLYIALTGLAQKLKQIQENNESEENDNIQ